MLFRQGSGSEKRSAKRTGNTSQAQLKELRTKARRRLIGALALVLAAFIVVPWLFEDPASLDARAPIVVPAPPDGLPPLESPQLAANTVPGASQAEPSGIGNSTQPPLPPSEPTVTGTVAAEAAAGLPPAQPESAATSAPPDSATAAADAPAADTAPSAVSEPSKKPADSSKPATKPVHSDRTDDGSVALALLAGKSPPQADSPAKPAAQGRYYLQVAAYTTEQDAQARRDSLHQAGVTDAYVERGQSSGRTVYRLRVGPFGSHEAAQAAQTRLRTLGYQNGLISDK